MLTRPACPADPTIRARELASSKKRLSSPNLSRKAIAPLSDPITYRSDPEEGRNSRARAVTDLSRRQALSLLLQVCCYRLLETPPLLHHPVPLLRAAGHYAFRDQITRRPTSTASPSISSLHKHHSPRESHTSMRRVRNLCLIQVSGGPILQNQTLLDVMLAA